MASLNLPENGYIGLGNIGQLSDEKYNALLAALQKFKPAVFHSKMLANIVQEATGLSGELASRAAESVVGVPLVYRKSSVPPEDFLRELADSLLERWKDDGVLVPLVPKIVERMTPLLQIEALSLSGLALAEAIDLPNSFSEALFSVDMRPLSYVGDNEVRGVMLISTLKLTYFGVSDSQEVSLTFDEVDLDALSDAIDDAKHKMELAKSLIGKADVSFVPVTASRRGG